MSSESIRYLLTIGVLLLTANACGLGPFAEEGSGAENLPISGAGPYRPLPHDFDTPADEPYVVVQPIVSLLDPAVRRVDEGFEIFYTRRDDTSSEIWAVDLPSTTDLPSSEPREVLVADSPWEQGSIRAPTIASDGDRVALYYEGGIDTPAIGRALSSDGGRSFQKDARNPVVAAGTDPFVTFARERWLMVYAALDEQSLLLRESDNGRDFGSARVLIEARHDNDSAFDQAGLRGPALIVTETLDGRERFGLFYTGISLNRNDERVEAIGYQGSFDGVGWHRFLAGEPTLNAGPAGAGGAAPLIDKSSALLFFHQRRQGRGRIAVAITP